MNPQSGRRWSFSSIYMLKAQFRSLRSLTHPEDAREEAEPEPAHIPAVSSSIPQAQ